MTPEQGIEQAEVMRRWHEQQMLPESERDILEFKQFGDWQVVTEPVWNFYLGEYRLRKRPRQKTVTVYLYRAGNMVFTCPRLVLNYKLLGQADITYEEENDEH